MALIAHCQSDREFLAGMSANALTEFTFWFNELNRFNDNDRAFYSSQALELATGIECWNCYFVSGLTPKQALDADIASDD